MRKFLALSAMAAVLAGGSLVAGSFDTVRADRFDRRIAVVNLTNVTIQTVNATNVGRADWGIDLLGQHVIPGGQTVVINVEDRTGYCRYDFRAIFANGNIVVRNRVNVCEVARWVLTA